MRRNATHLYDMSICALFAAFLCIVAPIALPMGPIPISLGLFGVLLAGVVLGPVKGFLSVMLYLLLGICGLPVFGGARGGIGVIAGPTGGFLWGYLVAVLVAGFLFSLAKDRKKASLWGALFCFAATLLCDLCGVVQYMAVANVSFGAALVVCFYPFVLIDLAKCLLVGFLGSRLRKILWKIGK